MPMTTAARRRLWLFPLAGILTGLPWVVFLFQLRPGAGTDQEALFFVSASTQASVYAYIAGFICLLVAIATLVVMAEAKRPSAWAVAALVLDVAAVAMITAVVGGVLALADRVVASYYLSGHQDVGPLLSQLSVGGSFAPNINAWLFVANGIALIGVVATGVSTWRAGIGRWSGVLLAAGFGLTLTITPLLSWVGSALLLGAGGWIAWRTNSSEVAAETAGIASVRASGAAT